MMRRRLVLAGPLVFVSTAVFAGAGSPGCGATLTPASEAGAHDGDFVDPPPYDVPDGALVVRCDDAGPGAPDAPIACAPAPAEHCEGPTLRVRYERVNDTCDPGGRCIYERIAFECGGFGGTGCMETEAGAMCPQVYVK